MNRRGEAFVEFLGPALLVGVIAVAYAVMWVVVAAVVAVMLLLVVTAAVVLLHWYALLLLVVPVVLAGIGAAILLVAE